MYEFVEARIQKNDWIMHVLLTSFLFVATIMLNILFGKREYLSKMRCHFPYVCGLEYGN